MPRYQPTVDDHCSPGYPLGFVAGEEERHVGDVRRMAGALDGMQLRQYLLDHLRVGGQKVENGRIDTAGAYAIDANLVLRHFERDRASQVDDSGLGGAVRVRPVPARETSNGGGLDYRAAAGLAYLGD